MSEPRETYDVFLSRKQRLQSPQGIMEPRDLSPYLKPFQRAVTLWALRQGRAAAFAGTGTGKTLIQLSWAKAVSEYCGKPVLILAPLAVAKQTLGEAEKFQIDGAAYAKDQSDIASTIVLTNYDRFDKFDMAQFGGIVLDESSIIKSHDSKTRTALIEACRDIEFKLCCTATPAPNDYVELGNHTEFLGVLTQKEMLATWFVHDGSIRATNGANHGKTIADWRLKGHAEVAFWRWLSTWAVMFRHPREIGFDEPGYDLPPLIKKQVTVAVGYQAAPSMGLLFPLAAATLSERIGARRDSTWPRIRAAAEIANSMSDRQVLVWCSLNDESAALTKEIDGAVEVKGSDAPEVKEERLLRFARGEQRVLVSKPSIAGFGMNFQNCSDMIFAGLNDSFEQLYQAIRRCWRFGQLRPVTAYMIASELEGAVVANLEAKEASFEHMAQAMLVHMADLSRRTLCGSAPPGVVPHLIPMEVPPWL